MLEMKAGSLEGMTPLLPILMKLGRTLPWLLKKLQLRKPQLRKHLLKKAAAPKAKAGLPHPGSAAYKAMLLRGEIKE